MLRSISWAYSDDWPWTYGRTCVRTCVIGCVHAHVRVSVRVRMCAYLRANVRANERTCEHACAHPRMFTRMFRNKAGVSFWFVPRPSAAPTVLLAELVTREGVNQGGVKERGRGKVSAMDEVSVPEGGMEEKRVNFWGVHLGIGGG